MVSYLIKPPCTNHATYPVVLPSKYVFVCNVVQLFIYVIPHASNSTVGASAQAALHSS